MKSKIALLPAGAVLALAIANVPVAAGQETAVIKTGRIASVPEQKVQLLADEEEGLPDSIIVYSPDGEKITKYVYLPDESYGQYTWENGAWKFSSASAYTFYSGIYDKGLYTTQSIKVSYTKSDNGQLWFDIPLLAWNFFYYYWSGDPEFTAHYDANGNLTSFRVLFGDGDLWHEYTVTYNARNNPLSIEGKHQTGDAFFKARYEYNNDGYCTLADSYEWDYAGDVWKSQYKETAEYDAQGKILYMEYYNYGEMTSKSVFEYYDETHFSLYIVTNYDDNGNPRTGRYEWKYDTDGKPEACYRYENDEFSEYAMFYYGDPSGNIPVSAGSNVWSSGDRLYIDAATAGAAQVYAISGQLLKTVALTAGQTVALPLPRGVYIVVAGGKTWKVIL